ncbi:MAG: hypothetical protein C4527_09465 [Candidatus Omnitrophota bacterium]|jgi:DNA-directed RNA polymerase specialized sigma24 family protein|nr:MAG: hypothetical protein C4527_09465 [Candidatus Omnitrophota bacterium]
MDQKLERGLAAGDPAAFAELFESYSNDLLRLGYSLLANVTDSADVVQDVLIDFVGALRSGTYHVKNPLFPSLPL